MKRQGVRNHSRNAHSHSSKSTRDALSFLVLADWPGCSGHCTVALFKNLTLPPQPYAMRMSEGDAESVRSDGLFHTST